MVVLILVVALTTGVLLARAQTGGSGTPGAPQTSSTTQAPSTTTPSPVPVGTYQVQSTAIQLEEPVSSGGTRSLPTTVWFPANSGAGSLSPDRSHGPYPLLVFSQGYETPVDEYQGLIVDWASAGFVVAAPTYPFTDPETADESDIVNHPADLQFVITSILDESGQTRTLLSGLINSNAIGLTGQSDGGDVTLAVAANSCCRDARVKAAAVLSGAELSSFGGTYFSGSDVPLLVVQGSADTVNPSSCSAQIYNQAPSPKYYLDLLGAGHLQPYIDAGPEESIVAKVTSDFFDAELYGDAIGLSSMQKDGDVSGMAQLSDGASAPPGSGVCIGAPGT